LWFLFFGHSTHDEIHEAGGGSGIDLGRHFDIAGLAPADAVAFYGILLGQQDRLAAAGTREHGREARVIRERTRLDQEPVRSQHGKEALGIADRGRSDDLAPGIFREGAARTVPKRHHGDRFEVHAYRTCKVRARSIDYDGVDLFDPRDRLAQRSRREPESIAEAAHAVHDHDLDVARECVMLQAVVAQDHVAIGLEQAHGSARRGATATGTASRLRIIIASSPASDAESASVRRRALPCAPL
jgi:hypothetical protein